MSMKEIRLLDIMPDPNQPRKFFDETAMQELVDSIREKGVLQPILVRPVAHDAGEYMLVCGERRYRAARIVAGEASIQTIPAVIRELSDDEALELQIVENLQRKDVHPLEEAMAFKSLLDHGKDIKEIAARIGKTEFYARQRMKLNALSKDWQKLFYAGRMIVSDALQVCVFDAKVQSALYAQLANTNSGKVEIKSWHITQYRGDLSNAAFDLSSTSLNKKMGACTSCQFNTSVSSLFPDSSIAPVCTNVACFKVKTDVHFEAEFERAIVDPIIIFAHTEYGNYSDNYVKKLEKSGHAVLGRNRYREIRKMDMPEWESYFEESNDEETPQADIRKAFDKEVALCHKELAEYEKKISGGKYKKVFMLTGSRRGGYVYAEIIKQTSSTSSGGSSKSTKEKEAAGTLTLADIDDEIKRLQDREKRNKELDLEKTHGDLLKVLEDRKEFDNKIFPLQEIDRGIMVFLLLAGEGMENDTIKGIPDYPCEGSYDEGYFKKLSKISDEQLALVIRKVAMDKLGSRNMATGIETEDTIMRIIAVYLGINVDAIELPQNELAANRLEKVNKRIAQLKEQKKELAKPTVKVKKGKGIGTNAKAPKVKAAKVAKS